MTAMPLVRRDGYAMWVGGPVPKGSHAITLGRLIVVQKGHEESPYLIRHELVHVRQWRRYGVLGFLTRYVGAYAKGRLRGYSHRNAYRRIPFEIEADWVARRILRGEHDAEAHAPTVAG